MDLNDLMYYDYINIIHVFLANRHETHRENKPQQAPCLRNGLPPRGRYVPPVTWSPRWCSREILWMATAKSIFHQLVTMGNHKTR